MAGGGPGGPGLAPPPQEPQQPQGMPSHLPQGPPGLNPAPGPPQHFGGYQPPAVNGKLYLYIVSLVFQKLFLFLASGLLNALLQPHTQ